MREAASRSSCVNNLHQIGLACHSFHDAYGRFPVVDGWVGMYGTYNGYDDSGESTFYWDIKPFVEQSDNDGAASVATFQCPSRRSVHGGRNDNQGNGKGKGNQNGNGNNMGNGDGNNAQGQGMQGGGSNSNAKDDYGVPSSDACQEMAIATYLVYGEPIWGDCIFGASAFGEGMASTLQNIAARDGASNTILMAHKGSIRNTTTKHLWIRNGPVMIPVGPTSTTAWTRAGINSLSCAIVPA